MNCGEEGFFICQKEEEKMKAYYWLKGEGEVCTAPIPERLQSKELVTDALTIVICEGSRVEILEKKEVKPGLWRFEVTDDHFEGFYYLGEGAEDLAGKEMREFHGREFHGKE
jgi:hypothetical protein